MVFDPRRSVSHFRVIVRIQTPPHYDPILRKVVDVGNIWGFDSAKPHDDPTRDLLSVQTSKSLFEPCGRFVLNFTPREPIAGKNWSEVIPPYSLVEILLHREGVTEEPRLVMLGLTDRSQVSEDYSAASPQRTVQVSGRELSAVLVDMRTMYLHNPPTPMSVIGAPGDGELPSLYQAPAQALGMLAIDPTLANEGESPVDAIDKFVTMLLTGRANDTLFEKDGRPMIDMQLPNAKLSDLLFFDAAKARAALFDPGAQLSPRHQLSDCGRSLWEVLEAFSDPSYQELFTRTVEQRTVDTANQMSVAGAGPGVEIIFRKKPFAGRIVSTGHITGVAHVHGSQFDQEFLDRPEESITIDGTQLIAATTGKSLQRVTNVYYVTPSAAVHGLEGSVRELVQPVVDSGPYAPASVDRLGVRPRLVNDLYFGSVQKDNPELHTMAATREQLLWAWHRFESLFGFGSYTLVGHPVIETGRRLVRRDRGRDWESYVTHVGHSVLLAGPQPRYTSSVSVERIWAMSNG